MPSQRYNLRSCNTYSHPETENTTDIKPMINTPDKKGDSVSGDSVSGDDIIIVEVQPSWNYGTYSLNSNKTNIYTDPDTNSKLYEIGFNETTPLYIVKNKLYDTIPLVGSGSIQKNLSMTFVGEKHEKPSNYSGDLNNEYPCKNFSDIFDGDNTRPLNILLKNNDDYKIVLYSHIGGTHSIPTGCCIC